MSDLHTLSCSVPTASNPEASFDVRGKELGGKKAREILKKHEQALAAGEEKLKKEDPAGKYYLAGLVDSEKISRTAGLSGKMRTIEVFSLDRIMQLRDEVGDKTFNTALETARKESVGFVPGVFFQKKLESLLVVLGRSYNVHCHGEQR